MIPEQRLELFLRDIGIHPAAIDLEQEVKRLEAAISEGLARDNAPLPMLASYIPVSTGQPHHRDAVVIDAGGTNLRVARVTFDANGAPAIDHLTVYPMPGIQAPVSASGMFDEIAAYLAPLVAGCRQIGFCFSYNFTPTPARDGIITAFCKEVDVRGAEGLLLGQELEAALRRQGLTGPIHCVVINDTIAVMLGGLAAGDCHAGLVLGTGLNACYAERTENITKLPQGTYAAPNMVVNMECGLYPGFPRSLPDQEIDARSLIPGDHLFEKQVSGAYFGAVIAATLQHACQAGLFSAEFSARLAQSGCPDLRAITQYIERRDLETNPCTMLIGGHEDDRAAFDLIIDKLYERAARMMAVLLGTIALKVGAGRDPSAPFKICAEGSTFYKSPLLLRHLQTLFADYWAAQRGIYIETMRAENTTLIGSALAALN